MKEDKNNTEKTALDMLHEMDIRREEQRKKLESDLQRLGTALDAVCSELEKTQSEPELVGQAAIAQQKVNAAFEKYTALQNMIRLYKGKKVAVASKKETAAFVRTAKKEFLFRLLCIADRMDELQSELISLSKEAAKIQAEKGSLFSRWKNEVSGGDFPEELDHWLSGYYELSLLHSQGDNEAFSLIHEADKEIFKSWKALQK